MAPVDKCGGFQVGQLVRILGIPDAVGLVLAIETMYHTVSQYQVCWLQILWSDLGPPANWERSEWLRHCEEDTDLLSGQ
jgi:hypothetical protein